MSTNAAVRTAWADEVFANINNGNNSYDYELNQDSQSDLSKFMYGKRIDAWSYTVLSREIPAAIITNEIIFDVTVKHYLQQNNDADSSNYNELVDSFRTLGDYVIDNLTQSWGTVNLDYFEGPSELEVELSSVGGTPTWIGQQKFIGHILVNG